MKDRQPSAPAAATLRPKVRLYVEQALGEGQPVSLSQEAAHYLQAVMRLGEGAEVALFNGRDGEWRAVIRQAGKRACTLECLAPATPQHNPPDLWLLFAPIKKARTDFIVEKATELGVARIQPVQSAFTNAERIRRDRLQAHAIEAAEQCGATFVPQVAELQPLARLLADWPEGRVLYWADEGRAGATALPKPAAASTSAAILIGPEGGFSPAERARLAALPFVRPMALGPRILRADTAAVAAITLWQVALGDWA
ncbi:MAG: 16S rRNA (uracil(1498)-N(3))-methyltransferase [Pararhodobacter sp.]